VVRNLRFFVYYLGLNLSAAMEYRIAFIAQALGMFINDMVFAVFWQLYFARFPNVAGWTMADIALVWAVAATSIGLATGVFGNCNRLATIVVQGQLDYYLGLPRNTLLHALVSRSGLAGWGDVGFGLLAYALFGRLDARSIALYAMLVVLSLTVYVSFMVMAGSLAFWIGNAEAAAFQAQQAVITFSLYPGTMFQGWMRVLLFTAIPAGFISHVPVELLRSFDPALFGGLLAIAGFSTALAVLVFHVGVQRYESGNLVSLRG
jgi:viologen exporter family transport system permease protein